MRQLLLGLNELSFVPSEIDTLEKGNRCSVLLFDCLKAAAKERNDLAVLFAPGALDTIVGGAQAKPLRAFLRAALGNDRFTWLIGRLRSVPVEGFLDCEVQVVGISSFGLLLAHSKKSWSVSLLPDPPKGDQVNVDAFEVCLEEAGLVESPCTIRHMARADHVAYWKNELAEYGFDADGSNLIARIVGLDIEMYPLDHGYPHLHLVDRRASVGSRRPVTVAKYRIDLFERMEGEPRYDSELMEFIAQNQTHLMRCWEACKKGRHPFQLEG